MQRTTILSWGFVVGLWGCNPSTVQGTRGAGDGAAMGCDGALLDGGGVDGSFGGDAVSGPDVPDGVVFLIHPEGAVPPRVETSARPLRPLSMSLLTTQRPGLHWILPPGAVGVQFQRCQDYRCNTVVETRQVMGTTFRYEAPLPVGTWFWRVRAEGSNGQAVGDWSASWQFRTPLRDTPTDGVAMPYIDLNGDGYADAAFTVLARMYVMLGSPTGLQAPVELGEALMSQEGRVADELTSGDINGDGLSDLVRHNTVGRRYYIHLGQQDSLPNLVQEFDSTQDRIELAGCGDINSDGYADVFVSHQIDGQWLGGLGLLGTPTGLHHLPRYTVDIDHRISPRHLLYWGNVTVSDLDMDGSADVTVLFHYPNLFVVYTPTSRHMMTLWGGNEPVVSMQVLSFPATSAFATLCRHDNSGQLSILFDIYLEDRSVGRRPVYWSRSGRDMSMPRLLELASATICFPDINGDGIDEQLSEISYALNLSGSAGLSSGRQTPFVDYQGFSAVFAAGDFDRDGMTDFAMAQHSNSLMLVDVASSVGEISMRVRYGIDSPAGLRVDPMSSRANDVRFAQQLKRL